MKFFSTLLWFGGYLLVYAAVANGGRFAAEPWEGLFNDAYTEERSPDQPQEKPVDPASAAGQGGPLGPSAGALPRRHRGGLTNPFNNPLLP